MIKRMRQPSTEENNTLADSNYFYKEEPISCTIIVKACKIAFTTSIWKILTVI